MTHSGGKPHPVGDRGQRYEVRYKDQNDPAEKIYGWTSDPAVAQRMADTWATRPSVERTWVVDRGERSCNNCRHTKPYAMLALLCTNEASPNFGEVVEVDHTCGSHQQKNEIIRPEIIDGITRDARQAEVSKWCAASFGADQASSVAQRGIRLLEESAEAYQAAGGTLEMAHKLVDYVFSRPVGDLPQEIGGIGITVLALAEAAHVSADEEEKREFRRVLSKGTDHFRTRNQAKNDAGFVAPSVDTGGPL